MRAGEDRTSMWVAKLAVAAVPVLVTAAVFFGRTHLLPVGGDEPHYLIMADSIAYDFDLDLRNNYERDYESAAIFGRVRPHALKAGGRWMPYHAPGLSVLLAVPYVIGGKIAARLALSLGAGVLSLALFVWLARTMARSAAAWMALGMTLSVPILFGSTLIYPDLPAGTVATALVLWLMVRASERETPGSPGGWAACWLLAGLLPWLNVKFAATTVVLAIGAAVVAWRPLRSGHERWAWMSCPLVIIGPAAMVLFNLEAYSNPWGGRGAAELTSSPLRALLIFLGLHFDQSQGMFLQQPLLLTGVMATLPFVWMRPRLALFWLAAYASLIVPNSLELARFGTAGPDGRFGWSAEWLWVVPLGFLVGAGRERIERWVRPLVTVTVAYQVALAVRWLAQPRLLFPRLQEDLATRDSLFPVPLRAFLPSYYLWDFKSYLIYPPNVAAVALTVGLMMAGAILLKPQATPDVELERRT